MLWCDASVNLLYNIYIYIGYLFFFNAVFACLLIGINIMCVMHGGLSVLVEWLAVYGYCLIVILMMSLCVCQQQRDARVLPADARVLP